MAKIGHSRLVHMTLIYINAKTTGMHVLRHKGEDSAMIIADFERAEAPTALQTQCEGPVRRQNIGLCAIVIVTVSLLGWAVIVWPLLGFSQ